jgi:hypothetical protein
MKRGIILLVAILLISNVSAELIIQQQPDELYSLGDTIKVPLKIATLSDLSAPLTLNLICNGIESEVYKEYIVLEVGEEIERNPSIPLVNNFIGRSTGICKIKATLGEDESLLTNDFTISNLILIEILEGETEFIPEGNIEIEGEAIKENNDLVDGVVEVRMVNEGEAIEIIDTIKNGYFHINFSVPADTKAGKYLVTLNAYEKDVNNEITSQGLENYEISISQVPTNLEVLFETENIEPGTDLKVKGILHDQTGEKMSSMVIISIKDNENTIREQIEIETDKFFELPIEYNELPSEWTVVAVSNKITSESTCEIIEKAKVETTLINQTLIVTNVGNVFYNDSVLVKIGNQSLELDVSLDIDKSQKYTLSAPDGQYNVEVSIDGENKLTETVGLTGKAIDIKKASSGVLSLARHPLVWIFIIAILGFLAFMVLKKGYKKSFIGKINFKKKENFIKTPLQKNSLVKSGNKAELSLSLKGEKQDVSLVCLKIKNLKEIQKKKSNAEEILQKVVDLAEEQKAVTYENQDNIIFILAPVKTKTFKNEKKALDLAQAIEKILSNHNKIAKQKISFGISMNFGTIVAKQEEKNLKFMSIGTLMTGAKKIASVSEGEVLISEKIKEKLMSDVRTEKKKKHGVEVYTITEVKKKGDTKFIKDFMNRLERK